MSDISLRDYFAAKAMQGMVAVSSAPTDSIVDENGQVDLVKLARVRAAVRSSIADMAYQMADAMLAERARGQPDRGPRPRPEPTSIPPEGRPRSYP